MMEFFLHVRRVPLAWDMKIHRKSSSTILLITKHSRHHDYNNAVNLRDYTENSLTEFLIESSIHEPLFVFCYINLKHIRLGFVFYS